MGILFKIILFGVVIYYILKTVGSFVFRIFGGRMQQQQQQRTQQQRKKEGEIHIDYAPREEKGKPRSGSKGGEYIDYEEVK